MKRFLLSFFLLLVAASVTLAQGVNNPGGNSVDLTAPGPIGGTTPSSGAFTSLSATGQLLDSAAGAASAPAGYFTGAIFTGGTGTTNFPHIFVQPTGATAATTWSTTGTAFGINAVTGFTGNFVDFKLAGATSAFSISSTGQINTAAAAVLSWTGRSRISSSTSGILELGNTSGTTFTRLNFRGAANSNGPAIGVELENGFTLQSAAGTATWNDANTAASGTVANRYLFGFAAPTLTATNTSVTDTVASTVYIGGAPTAGTNTTIGSAYALNVATGNTILGGTVAIGGGQAIVKSLSAAATLNFGSTAASTTTDLTIALTGATLGDVVGYGIPNGSMDANGFYQAWVSASDVVTVRFRNLNTVTAIDPESGTFRISILRF